MGKPDKDCYFAGHSLGCITILRYLEGLGEGEKVGGAFLVAGFTESLGYKETEGFFKKPPEWERIRPHCGKFLAIHSDNDPYVPLVFGDILKKELGAKLLVQHNMGHFSGDDGTKELPILLEKILEVSRDS